mmetsp:Transcript_81924/g.235385  ORF Transcript_81924/g.235385 Transcript_81924/m.235385 type:complete len:255 (-) Transcript_81924:22-786(-)
MPKIRGKGGLRCHRSACRLGQCLAQVRKEHTDTGILLHLIEGRLLDLQDEGARRHDRSLRRRHGCGSRGSAASEAGPGRLRRCRRCCATAAAASATCGIGSDAGSGPTLEGTPRLLPTGAEGAVRQTPLLFHVVSAGVAPCVDPVHRAVRTIPPHAPAASTTCGIRGRVVGGEGGEAAPIGIPLRAQCPSRRAPTLPRVVSALGPVAVCPTHRLVDARRLATSNAATRHNRGAREAATATAATAAGLHRAGAVT